MMNKGQRLAVKPDFLFSMVVVSSLLPSGVMADAIGTLDARTLAMGGAAVAVGSSHEGPWYNPALLAMHQGDEDETLDGRMGLPNLTAIASDSLREAYQLSQDDVSLRLSDAIDRFNTQDVSSVQDAQTIADLSERLVDVAETFRDESVLGDFTAGWVLSEPGDWQGGGFYIRSRFFTEGQANVTEDDLTNLTAVREGFRFLATNGEAGSPQPDILDANGNVVDVTRQLTSELRASATVLLEAGVSMSKVWTLFGHPVALGVTPKWTSWRSEVFRVRLSDSTLQRLANRFSNVERINLDLGAAMRWGDGWRAGLSAVNVVPHRMRFGDLSLYQDPTLTLGVGQISPHWRWGVDAQLMPVALPGSQMQSQWLSMGGEWRPYRALQFRAGWREDLNGDFERRWSLGGGFYWGRVSIDLARMWSQNDDGFGLQVGYAL